MDLCRQSNGKISKNQSDANGELMAQCRQLDLGKTMPWEESETIELHKLYNSRIILCVCFPVGSRKKRRGQFLSNPIQIQYIYLYFK